MGRCTIGLFGLVELYDHSLLLTSIFLVGFIANEKLSFVCNVCSKGAHN